MGIILLPEELGNQLKSGEDGINRTIHWLLGSWLLSSLGPDRYAYKLEPRLHLSCWTAPWRMAENTQVKHNKYNPVALFSMQHININEKW